MVRFQRGKRNLSLPQNVHTYFWKQLAANSNIFGNNQLPIRWLGLNVHHSPPSSAELKNEWSYASISPYAFTLITRTIFLLNSHCLSILLHLAILVCVFFLIFCHLLCEQRSLGEKGSFAQHSCEQFHATADVPRHCYGVRGTEIC
jgi:hypothetical protein